MASLKKSYCHLCFYVESQDRPIIKLACNHTICIVCNTETYCALCRLSKYFVYSMYTFIARRVKCTVMNVNRLFERKGEQLNRQDNQKTEDRLHISLHSSFTDYS